MARGTSFSILYLAGMAAVMLGAVVAGSLLNDESRLDLGAVGELGLLALGAVLFVSAGIGARLGREAGWPLVCAVGGITVAAVLALLTLGTDGFGFAVIYELGALFIGFLLIQEIRKR